MTYLPNFSDKRVLKKIKDCYSFALSGILSTSRPKQFPQSYLIKIFGQSQNPLSKWLRKQLLICTNEEYCFSKGVASFDGRSKSKEYILNSNNLDFIRSLLKIDKSISDVEFDISIVLEFYNSKYDKDFKNVSDVKNFLETDLEKKHYVYRITNTIQKKHYYGRRSCLIEPKLDLGFEYFSSSTDDEFILDQKINPQNYRYKIVSRFDSVIETINRENKLHRLFNVHINNKFYNKLTRKQNEKVLMPSLVQFFY